MTLFAGMAARFQPHPDNNKGGDEEKFDKYAALAVDCAHKLAPYQSPTFRALVVAPAPDSSQPERRRRFTLTVFEQPARRLEPPPAPPTGDRQD